MKGTATTQLQSNCGPPRVWVQCSQIIQFWRRSLKSQFAWEICQLLVLGRPKPSHELPVCNLCIRGESGCLALEFLDIQESLTCTFFLYKQTKWKIKWLEDYREHGVRTKMMIWIYIFTAEYISARYIASLLRSFTVFHFIV